MVRPRAPGAPVTFPRADPPRADSPRADPPHADPPRAPDRPRSLLGALAVVPPMAEDVARAFVIAARTRSARALASTTAAAALLATAAAVALVLVGAAGPPTALVTLAVGLTLAAFSVSLRRPSTWLARHPAAALLAAVVSAALLARLAPAGDIDPRSWRGLSYLLPFASVVLFTPPTRRALITVATLGAWAALTWTGDRMPALTAVEAVVYAVLLGLSTALSVAVGHLLYTLAARQHIASAALVTAGARLGDEVAAQREALRASRRSLLARAERLRARLAHDLHDSSGQTLTALRLELELAMDRARTVDDEIRFGRVAGKLDRVVARVRALLDDLSPPAEGGAADPAPATPPRSAGAISAPRAAPITASPPASSAPSAAADFAVAARREAVDLSRAFAVVLAAVVLMAWPTDALLPDGMALTLLPMRVLGTVSLVAYALLAHRWRLLQRHPALSLALLTAGALGLTLTGGHTMALDGPWSDQILLLPMATILVPARPLARAAMAAGVGAAFVVGFFAAFPEELTSARATLLVRDLAAAAVVATAIGHLTYRLRWRSFLAARAVADANAAMGREVDAQTRALRELAARESRLAQDERERIAERLAGEVERPIAALRRELAEDPPEALAPQEVARLLGHLDALTDQLDRACRDLGPRPLDGRTLAAALGAMVESASASGAPVVARIAPSPALPQAVARAFYHVAQEALTNALKHSGAGRIEVGLAATAGGGVTITVSDDGRASEGAPLAGGAGLGMASMRARAEAIGGRLEVARDGGVRVTLSWTPAGKQDGPARARDGSGRGLRLEPDR